MYKPEVARAPRTTRRDEGLSAGAAMHTTLVRAARGARTAAACDAAINVPREIDVWFCVVRH